MIKNIKHIRQIVIVISTILICISSLVACGQKNYSVTKDGKTFIVDYSDQTVTVDGYVCKFSISDDGKNVIFTYPNGSTYSGTYNGNVGIGGYSDDYNAEEYVDGEILCDVLEMKQRSTGFKKSVLLVVVPEVLGILYAAFPRVTWNLWYNGVHRWIFKNTVEPSKSALVIIRVFGIAAILGGLVYILV